VLVLCSHRCHSRSLSSSEQVEAESRSIYASSSYGQDHGDHQAFAQTYNSNNNNAYAQPESTYTNWNRDASVDNFKPYPLTSTGEEADSYLPIHNNVNNVPHRQEKQENQGFVANLLRGVAG